MTIWLALTLSIRRAAIATSIAFGRHAEAEALISDYVDAVLEGLRS